MRISKCPSASVPPPSSSSLLLARPPAPPTGRPRPPSAAWGPRCYLVPPERSTSLFRCVELCKEHGGAPACIGSAEENRHVTAGLAATEGLWLGLYQNETGLGPAKGWSRCVAGDAPSFTNWRGASRTTITATSRTVLGRRQHRAVACSGVRRRRALRHFPWRIARALLPVRPRQRLGRVCRRSQGAGGNQRLQPAAAHAANGDLLLNRRRPRPTAHPSAPRPNGLAPAAPLRTLLHAVATSATGAAPSTPSGAASSAAAKGKLRAARASAAARRLRVSFAMGQAGWALS